MDTINPIQTKYLRKPNIIYYTVHYIHFLKTCQLNVRQSNIQLKNQLFFPMTNADIIVELSLSRMIKIKKKTSVSAPFLLRCSETPSADHTERGRGEDCS